VYVYMYMARNKINASIRTSHLDDIIQAISRIW